VDVDAVLGGLYELITPHLTEKQRRLLAGAAARALGRGGGAHGADQRAVPPDRVHRRARAGRAARARRPGAPPGWWAQAAGRAPAGPAGSIGRAGGPGHPRGPRVAAAVDLQVHPGACRRAGRAGLRGLRRHRRGLLKQQRYTLQRTQKTEEGAQHPDRDAQSRYINDTARACLDQGLPVVSVDTKKKELVGNYANGGAEWQPVGEPERVLVHDFPDPAVGKAIPYGVYDLGAGTGWVWSAPTMTPPRSRWRPCGAGGNGSAGPPILMLSGCW
jgi:Rhodopirellula transposase DDE domain